MLHLESIGKTRQNTRKNYTDMENKENILCIENYQSMIEWLNGSTETEPEFASTFMTLIYLKYMDKKGPISISRRRTPLNLEAIPSLKRMMAQIERDNEKKQNEEPKVDPTALTAPEATQKDIKDNPSKENEETKTEPTAETQIKSQIIGKAVRHCARLHGIKISPSHIQIIMYVLYGYRMATDKEDVFKERPQMWKYGPVFASSFSQLKKAENIPDEHECWKAVNSYDVKLGTDMISLVTGLGERNIKELSSKHTAPGTPWHQCRVMNPDKWGTVIPDEYIKEWFKEQNNKTKRQ